MLNAKSTWTFLGHDRERSPFGSLESARAMDGPTLSRDAISSVKKIRHNGCIYYIKHYTRNGKGLRQYIGRGRLQGEWENLLYFAQLGIAIPRIVAYGQHCRWGQFKEGILITEEVTDAHDLLTLSRQHPEYFTDKQWLRTVLQQTADYTRCLHQQGFVHWDLKWRNILVATPPHNEPQVYFFDCPLGRRRWGWLKQRGAIKDLACLDKVGRKTLSRSQRLTFFRDYLQTRLLSTQDKQTLKRVLTFFAN